MRQYPIAVIVGSLRRDSLNRQLATALARLAPEEFSFTQLPIEDLPLYNQDDDASPAAGAAIEAGDPRRARFVVRNTGVQSLNARRS